MPETRFSVTYDRTTMVLSAIVCAVLLVPVAFLQNVLVALGAFLVLLVGYAYSPRGYLVSGDAIIVERLIGNVRVPLERLLEARPATPEDFRGCVRLWGNAGLFGYYGLFRTARLGKCTWYATNQKHRVVVRTEKQVIVLSPDDPDGLVAALHPLTHRAEVQDEPWIQSLLSAGPSSRLGVIIGVAGGAMGLIAVAFALVYAPGSPGYSLTPDTLSIHDRFYPVTLRADTVDIDHVQIVDLDEDSGWLPTRRTNGFSNAHYHSGWYRVRNGQRVRMYRADSRRLVLLPPKGSGAAVLYEVPDPEHFVAKLRREWAGHT